MGRWRRASQIVNRLRCDRLLGSPRDSIRGYPTIPLPDIGAQLRREREIVYGSLSGFRQVGGGGTWRTTIRCFGSLASKVARDPSFAKITAEDISYFEKILGVKNVIQDEDRLIASNTDWMRKYKGSSQLLLQPSSTDEVSQILKYCNFRRLAVVPQGGNTGLVGGSVPVFDEVITYLEGVRNPFPSSDYNFYVLIETTGSTESHDKEKLESFLMKSMEGGLISDGVVAQDMNQTSSFWRIREGISEALVRAGAVYKYDLSLPVEKIYEIVEEMRSRLGQSATVLGYGHLGDGNLHLNVSVPEYDDKVSAKIEPFVYEWTSKHRGSISAEHGLGQMKANEIHYSKPVEAVQLMASIKKLLDPNGIMNPYKVLPQSVLC